MKISLSIRVHSEEIMLSGAGDRKSSDDSVASEAAEEIGLEKATSYLVSENSETLSFYLV